MKKLFIEQYSKKSHVIRGEVEKKEFYPYINKFKLRWNPRLKNGAGCLFPSDVYQEIYNILSKYYEIEIGSGEIKQTGNLVTGNLVTKCVTKRKRKSQKESTSSNNRSVQPHEQSVEPKRKSQKESTSSNNRSVQPHERSTEPKQMSAEPQQGSAEQHERSTESKQRSVEQYERSTESKRLIRSYPQKKMKSYDIRTYYKNTGKYLSFTKFRHSRRITQIEYHSVIHSEDTIDLHQYLNPPNHCIDISDTDTDTDTE